MAIRRYTEPRPEAVFDVECYIDYFMIGFRDIERGRTKAFEFYDGCGLDRPGIAKLLRLWRLFSFNGNRYDMLMLAAAMNGCDNEQLKDISDRIIIGGLTPWQFEEKYGWSLPGFIDHVDLIEVAPGVASLKIYGGRLHSKRMQDLPIDPSANIAPHQRPVMVTYNGNDLATTADLRHELREQIALRERMSDEYGIDLRSKSDAQVAEAVIKKQIEQELGRKVYRPDIEPGSSFKYLAPRFITFQTPQMRALLDDVKSAFFTINYDGTVKMPQILESAKIAIGDGVYRMGIGGLHSSEKSVSHYSDDEIGIYDRDVASYYPMLILGTQLAPKHLGPAFLKVYKGHVDARLECKKRGDKAGANSRKIMVNGTFGKLGSPYSIFYAPNLMIQVTITGQLALLMLIELLELAGFEVISANTDGVVTRVERHRKDDFDAILFDWELATDFTTEETQYRSLHSRDVNNYIAIPVEGKPKTKGAYAPSGPGLPASSGLMKNPANAISVDAAVEYLKDGTPLYETIEWCDDIRRFVNVRQVKGGAEREGEYLGKAIRWYYAEGVRGGIHYVTNGNSVPRSEGAMPLMELPDRLPDDVDFDWYAREADGILRDVGVKAPKLIQRRMEMREGFALARLPDAKNIHTVDLSTMVGICGQELKGRHDKWVEYDEKPSGHRECPKCVRAMGGL
jgi:hypothetical protein